MNALDKVYKPIIKEQYPELDLEGWEVEFCGNEVEMVDDLDEVLFGIEDGSINSSTEEYLRNLIFTVKPPPGGMFLRLTKPEVTPMLLIINRR